MTLIEMLSLPFLHRLDPETGHEVTIRALNMGLTPQRGAFTSPRIAQRLAGMTLPNPIGLAAGFDKNAEAIKPLMKTGFGFIEVGAATPNPQPGNPKPRLFRLSEDKAAINRFGFNNEGMEAIAQRLRARKDAGVVGINLGANKLSENRTIDYIRVLETCGPYVDFATINVSSPNTERLRELQGKEQLYGLAKGAVETRDSFERPIPVFIKVAPDIDDRLIEDISEVARMMRIDGVICTNTTTRREGLRSAQGDQKGGLSGAPLFEIANDVQVKFARSLQKDVPIIGVGGVASAEDAYQKIRLGASAVQLYTALVFNGFSLINRIARELDALLERDGFEHISDAVGVDL